MNKNWGDVDINIMFHEENSKTKKNKLFSKSKFCYTIHRKQKNSYTIHRKRKKTKELTPVFEKYTYLMVITLVSDKYCDVYLLIQIL